MARSTKFPVLPRWRCAGLFVAALASALVAAPAAATPERAAGFYEDALKRYEGADTAGAIIQLKNALQQDNKMLAAHLLLGKALLKNGDLKGAEAAFEEALKQGVSRGEVALPLGRIYLALGRPEHVIERIPASGLPLALQVDVLTMRGTAYAELGKAELARKSFEEARAIDPGSVVPLLAEVPVLLASGQIDKARSAALKSVELAPQDAYAWNMQASVQHAALDVGGALAGYDKALSLEPRHVDARVARAALLIDLNRDDAATADLDYLRTAAPGEPRAAYLRALLASRAGDTRAVTDSLNEVVKLIDALPPAWLAGREQLLMVGAMSHHGLGNWEKARDYLNVILNRNPRNLAAKKLLASIYLETRDYSRAQSQLEALQKATPDDPQVLYLLGSVHLAQRRYAQASELLEKAVARTGSAEMTRSLGFSQIGLGRGDLGVASLEKAFTVNPGDTRAGMTLAMIYLRRGQTQKALQAAEAMARRDPANLSALNFLGSMKAATGDRAGARAAYTQVLAKNAAFRPATVNLARLDAAESRYDDARRRLNELLGKQRDDPDILFELGLVEQRAGRPDDAARHLQKAIELQRKDPRAGLALVDLRLSQRQGDQALAAAKELSARFPDNLAVQLALGRTHLALGDHASARSIFHSSTRLAEFDPAMQVRIGHLQLAAGNPEGASYNAQKALQGRPDDPAALALLVEVEARRGDSAKADAALKTLTAKHPNRVETALASANLALQRGQYPAAIAAYRTALAREESTANALALVRAQVAAGETAKAAAFLEDWMRRHPNDLAALKALAEAQFRAGQLAAARESYARVVAIAPDDAVTLNNYANLLLQLNDPTAQATAEKAVKLSPSNPNYADTLGWILVRTGQVDAGLRYLREARLRSPENGEIRFHLAWALARTGRMAEAKEELSAALAGPGKVSSSLEVGQLRKELGL
ncbi:MAG: PEP-CTERM system TPR-repeat protein PrsT [Betaproteobacteria bacterium]|nr:PEP-CTERM system TPR-repeat protein PrsT [Betaproteobacteria bacterium]